MSDTEKMTILGIGAHPTDIFGLIGGTVAKHVKRGDNVILIFLTYDADLHTKDLIDNCAEAAIVLGVDDHRFLNFGESPLVSSREKLLELGEAIQDIRPDIIISAHYPVSEDQAGGGHGADHSVVARMLEQAPSWRRHAGKEPHRAKAIYYCAIDALFPLRHPVNTVPDAYVDITDTMEQKLQATAKAWEASASFDFDAYAETARTMHRFFGASVGVEYAEPFVSPRRQRAVDYLTY